MVDWHNEKPRAQHYQYAHRFLPRMLRRPDADLVAGLSSGRMDELLHNTWKALGEPLDNADRIDVEGLRAESVEVGGEPGLLVTFPPVRGVAEAVFALVLPLDPPESRRYLTLEASWNPLFDRPRTVLGEWTAEDHLNLGDGSEPNVSAFLALVADRVLGQHGVGRPS